MPDNYNNNDHDLLIALHEQMKGIRSDIKEIKDNTKAEVADHESRIRRLERWGAMGLGALTILQLAFEFYK